MGGHVSSPLLFATVGTESYPFERLVRWVDSWAVSAPGVRCFVQHGAAAPPRHAEGAPFLAFHEVEELLREAEVVVCHGGTGTIVLSRRQGLVPVVVPRARAHGEHVDDHQVRFARRLAALGEVEMAESEERLHVLLNEAFSGKRSMRGRPVDAPPEGVERFARLVDALAADAPSPPRRVRVLYVGGTGRSGSTLLDRMLGEIPGFVSVGEVVHLWRRGLAGDQLCGCGERFRACPYWADVGEAAFGGWDRLQPAEVLGLQRSVDRNRFIPLMLAPRGRYRDRLRRYAHLLGRLYGALASVAGARVVVDSSKHASTAFLLRRVPGVDLRVAHLVRDSRGVAFSWGRRVRRPEVVAGEAYMPTPGAARAGTDWVAYNGLFELLRLTGVPMLLVRYESLVADPRRELERILHLTGEGLGDDALAFLRDGAAELGVGHTVSGNPMRFRTGPVELRPDEEWRHGMDPGRRRLVSAITMPLLYRYGYRVRGGGDR